MRKQPKISVKILLMLVKCYQYFISPWFGKKCRFTPTCSEYACQALLEYGLLKGGVKSLYRILRCNPFCKWGYDPVKKEK